MFDIELVSQQEGQSAGSHGARTADQTDKRQANRVCLHIYDSAGSQWTDAVSLCDQDELRTRLDKTAIDFMRGVEQGGDARAIRKGEDKDTWIEAHKVMTEEVPRLLELLDDDLRKTLGTHEE